MGLIPGSGRSPGGGHSKPLPYSCLEKPMDRGAQGAIVHWVAQSNTTEGTQHGSHSSAWLCPVQNRACTHHQSRKGMQIGICPRPVDSCKLQNHCISLPIIQSVLIKYIYTYRIFMNPRLAPSYLGFLEEAPVVSLYPLCLNGVQRSACNLFSKPPILAHP